MTNGVQIDWQRVRRRAARLRELRRAHGVQLAASSLSGGNQQKMVVARNWNAR